MNNLVSKVCLISLFAFNVGADSINLLVLGDWGGAPAPIYTLPGQVAAAAGMGVVGAKLNADAVLALGDNFYFSGVASVDSKRFSGTWDSVYTADSLQIPWYVLAGNHDHKGNVSAQIEYSSISERWMFPALYHSKSFVSADSSVTVDVLLLDTIDLAGASDAVDESDPRYFDPLPHRSRAEAAEQWDWIEQQLNASTAQYLLVAGHYPVYSVCEHGNTQNLIDNLQPLLQQYGAHYLSGHDHCMASLNENQVQYMVSGMGDTCCYEDSNLQNVPPESLQWYIARRHKDDQHTIAGFSSISATAEAMTFSFYDQDGNMLFTAAPIAPRSSAQ